MACNSRRSQLCEQHIAPLTEFSLLNLDDHTAQLRVTQGAVSIRVRTLNDRDLLEIDTPNGAVSVLRAEAHWIITEYGARNLRGMTLRERAKALIEIAHPDFRAELASAARARHLLA